MEDLKRAIQQSSVGKAAMDALQNVIKQADKIEQDRADRETDLAEKLNELQVICPRPVLHKNQQCNMISSGMSG